MRICSHSGVLGMSSAASCVLNNSFRVNAIFVVDPTQKSTFNELNEWIDVLNESCAPNAFKILVGNKSDLTDLRKASVCMDSIVRIAARTACFAKSSRNPTNQSSPGT